MFHPIIARLRTCESYGQIIRRATDRPVSGKDLCK